MPLDWFAEPFQPYGSFAGEGARRVLGKPELDPLAVLVRETGQNAWDAKREDAGSVDFSIVGWTMNETQHSTLRHKVFARRPPDGLPLAAALDRYTLEVLCISDRGTRGLAGPTRADQPTLDRTDFIDYVFNMGQPRNIADGGGTYGFGKTITYVASRAGAVIVQTRTRTEHGLETRIIGIAVGSQYEDAQRRYTGRHWWGITDGTLVQPVVGDAAGDLGVRLGLPRFGPHETGTDILILAPDFGGRTALRGMQYIAEAALWHFWPKAIAGPGGHVPMRFRFAWDGVPVSFPPVDTYPPLHAFARAFRGVKAFQRGDSLPEGVFVKPIESLRPRRRLGALGIVRVPHRARVPLGTSGPEDEEGDDSPAPFAGNSHHVALMRQVNLVVTYRPGPELPLTEVEWAGVFINEPDIDPAFAEAEPPTHDEWKPAMVADKVQKRLVNVALRNVDAALRLEFGAPAPTAAPQVARSPVVVADALGGLLASSLGTGPQRQELPGSGGERPGGRGARHASVVEITSRLILFEGERCTLTQFRVEAPDGTAVTVTARASVAIDGVRAEREPPLGSAAPSIVGWGTIEEVERGRLDSGQEFTVPEGDRSVWAVVIRNPGATALGIELTARAAR